MNEPEVGIRLRPAALDDMELLSTLMKPREVWRNLEYQSAPTPFLLRILFKRPDWHAIIIEREDDHRAIGFFLLYGRVAPDADVEFDIAIPDENDRRFGQAKRCILAFEEYMLGGGRCASLWAWIDEENRASLALVRQCRWPIAGRVKKGLEMVDGDVDCVEVRLSLDAWRTLRRKASASG